VKEEAHPLSRSGKRSLDKGELSYHPGDYSPPHDRDEVFQVWVGSILAQNTTWKMASRALINLAKAKAPKPCSLIEMRHSKLELIKPAGFLNQKAEYLKEISKFFITLKGVPRRDELLSIKGVGDETADTILLLHIKFQSLSLTPILVGSSNTLN